MSQSPALNYQSTRTERPLAEVSKPPSSPGKCLSVALGVILLIGSLVAAGLLYQQLGYFSLAIASVGVVLSVVSFVLSSYCGSPETIKSEHPIPLPSKPEMVKALKPQSTPERTPEVKKEVPPPKAEEKKPQPVLPPLPFIFDLQKLGSSPLLQSLPQEAFLRLDGGGNIGPFLLSRLLLGEKEKESEALLNRSDLDSDLLNIPLFFWLNPEQKHLLARDDHKTLNDPRRTYRIALINDRIKALNAAVQLEERFQRLGSPFIMIRDLLPAWPQSPLRVILMLDDELAQLKVSSIKQMDPVLLWDKLHTRIHALADKKTEFNLPAPLTEENIDTILLIDLPKFNAQQINAGPLHFTPLTFLLLPHFEL